jgi:hypothetical protein
VSVSTVDKAAFRRAVQPLLASSLREPEIARLHALLERA